MFRRNYYLKMSPDPANPGAAPVIPSVSDDTATLKAALDKANKDIQDMKSLIGRNNKKNNNNNNKKDGLFQKAQDKQTRENNTQATTAQIENALSFNIQAPSFYENHKDLLPGDVDSIIKLANSENYDNAMQKSSAIKSGIIESFFAVESNNELLTASQKIQLADFKKMTKNSKEAKASQIFEIVLEPALEIIKRVKKAEELTKARGGFSSSNTVTDDYKQRLINGAKKRHLNIKE